MTDDQFTSLQRSMREGFAAIDRRFVDLEGRMSKIEWRMDATDKILEDMGKRMATKGDVYQAVLTVFALLVGTSGLVLLALNVSGAFAAG